MLNVSVALSMVLGTVNNAHAQTYTVDDVHAALEGASARAACIVRYETGSTYNPYAYGAQGEQGVAQLHPRGLLRDFYAQGYIDPYNPYEAVAYLDAALARGMSTHWSPVLRELC